MRLSDSWYDVSALPASSELSTTAYSTLRLCWRHVPQHVLNSEVVLTLPCLDTATCRWPMAGAWVGSVALSSCLMGTKAAYRLDLSSCTINSTYRTIDRKSGFTARQTTSSPFVSSLAFVYFTPPAYHSYLAITIMLCAPLQIRKLALYLSVLITASVLSGVVTHPAHYVYLPHSLQLLGSPVCLYRRPSGLTYLRSRASCYCLGLVIAV